MEHRFEISEGPPCNLARKLIAEGKADRSDRLVILRDGKPVLRGGVGWYADRRIKETATVGPLYAKWIPIPDARRHALGPSRPLRPYPYLLSRKAASRAGATDALLVGQPVRRRADPGPPDLARRYAGRALSRHAGCPDRRGPATRRNRLYCWDEAIARGSADRLLANRHRGRRSVGRGIFPGGYDPLVAAPLIATSRTRAQISQATMRLRSRQIYSRRVSLLS